MPETSRSQRDAGGGPRRRASLPRGALGMASLAALGARRLASAGRTFPPHRAIAADDEVSVGDVPASPLLCANGLGQRGVSHVRKSRHGREQQRVRRSVGRQRDTASPEGQAVAHRRSRELDDDAIEVLDAVREHEVGEPFGEVSPEGDSRGAEHVHVAQSSTKCAVAQNVRSRESGARRPSSSGAHAEDQWCRLCECRRQCCGCGVIADVHGPMPIDALAEVPITQ